MNNPIQTLEVILVSIALFLSVTLSLFCIIVNLIQIFF